MVTRHLIILGTMFFCCLHAVSILPDDKKELVIAALTGDFVAAQVLLKTTDPARCGYDLSSFIESIRWHCFEEQASVTEHLLTSNDFEKELLNEAAKKVVTQHKNSLLDVLIHHICDINAFDKDGKALLHHAAIAGNLEATKVLVQAGADKELMSHEGMTAGEYAHANNYSDLMFYLQSEEGVVSFLTKQRYAYSYGASSRTESLLAGICR